MSGSVKNAGFAAPSSMGKGVGGNFTKHYFDGGKCLKCPSLHIKLHFCKPPLKGLDGVK